MSSSIFFRFKSQRDPSQISFDGTSLSVFEVKREIMSIARLGDGKDFDLDIYTSDKTEEKYDDDTTQIPRSTTVLARRQPAARPGAGRAARYVTGQMPLHARNQHRTEGNAKGKAAPTPNGGLGDGKAMTEEEKLQAVLNASNNQMQADLAMSSGKPVIRSNHNKQAAVPDKPLPPGYMCHRCGKTGHWIQACPTNNDPAYDGKHKFKRTTGIPKSFHVAVDTSDAIGDDGVVDPTKLGKGVMYTQDGTWVKARTDDSTWQKLQDQMKANAEKAKKEAESDQGLRDLGLECSIDNRPFTQPVKTPCCGTTYCRDCIENTLLDNDLKCPKCGEMALIDNLEPDDESAKKLTEYREEKKAEKLRTDKDASKSPAGSIPRGEDAKSPSAADTEAKGADSPASTSSNSKKRRAEDELENKRRPVEPAEMNNTASKQGTPAAQSHSSTPQPQVQPPKAPKSMTEFVSQMNSMAGTMADSQNSMNAMMNPMMGMNPMMMGGMGMNMPMMPSMMPNFNMMNGGFPNVNMGMMNGGMGMNGGGEGMGWHQPQQWNNGGSMRNGIPTGPAAGNGDGGAYFRQPVNPHRHQGRGRRQRSVDYKQM